MELYSTRTKKQKTFELHQWILKVRQSCNDFITFYEIVLSSKIWTNGVQPESSYRLGLNLWKFVTHHHMWFGLFWFFSTLNATLTKDSQLRSDNFNYFGYWLCDTNNMAHLFSDMYHFPPFNEGAFCCRQHDHALSCSVHRQHQKNHA